MTGVTGRRGSLLFVNRPLYCCLSRNGQLSLGRHLGSKGLWSVSEGRRMTDTSGKVSKVRER